MRRRTPKQAGIEKAVGGNWGDPQGDRGGIGAREGGGGAGRLRGRKRNEGGVGLRTLLDASKPIS